MLVCAGGMSSSILVNQLVRFFKERGLNWSVSAHSGVVVDYDQVRDNYDIVLIAPQLSYRLNDIQSGTGLICGVIPSFDYATANCVNIENFIKNLWEGKGD